VPIFESMFYEDWLTMKKRQTRREQEPDYFTNNARMIEAKKRKAKSPPKVKKASSPR